MPPRGPNYARPIPVMFHGGGASRPADRHTHSDDVDYEYDPFPDGDVSTPPACWDQHPGGSNVAQFYDRIVRWGDQQTIPMEPHSIAAVDFKVKSNQLVMYETKKPYGVRVTLNAFDSQLVAANAGIAKYFVTWTVYVGCGAAMRTYTFTQAVQQVPTPLGSDIVLDVSGEVVRVFGVAEFTAIFTPQKASPTLVAACAPQVWLPDEEVGPRSNTRNVIR